MSFTALLSQTARVLRRPAPSSVEGTPIEMPPAEVGSYPARLDWGGGGEGLTAVSDQRRYARSAMLFLDPDVDIRITDVVMVDDIDVVWEVESVTPIRGFSELHHLEVSLSFAAGT